jgi:uncharacterized repeat protein (TIGR03806 family)
MRAPTLLVASLSAAIAACVLGETPEEETGSATAAVTSCLAGARPSTGFTTAPALGDLSFSMPVGMIASPTNRNRFYVVEKKGFIRRVETNGEEATSSLFLDISARVNSGPNEAGLLGLALHPSFAQNGHVYLSYTKKSPTSPANLASVIARVTTTDGGLTLDPSTIVELLVFDQPYSNHNGGSIAFGPDGYLYAAFGDGGSGGDPQGNGQNTNSFLGKMLRIDVDHGSPYAIPDDNPFKNGGGRPEIFAWGLRNTWRFSFDRVAGDLWAGDVGQNKYEEIDKIVLGGNYGWGMREGFHCYRQPPCDVPGAIDPIVEYDHSQGYSVTGGYVYRGISIPELYGHYVYGDFGSGKIWAIPSNVSQPTPRVLVDTSHSIASFAEDLDGELYVLDYGSGKIRKLVQTFASDGVPQKLSQTGCFLADDPRVPSSTLVPYDLNSPLWSDGSEKSRWMALPSSGKIAVGADGDWDLPPGTVLVKEFRLGGKRIETRLFMRHTDGTWAGYSYEWNDDETDAILLPHGKTKDVGGQTWTYPSRSQCMTCHNAAAGGSLGLETAQLDRTLTYPDGTTANQLDRLEAMGVFSTTAPLPATRTPLPSPSDTTASLEQRARSYLHANCAFCHRPQGPGRGAADLRFSRTLKGTRLCEGIPETGDLGIADAKLVVPGDPSRSLISVRMHRTDDARMPPIASAIVDPTGTSVVDAWIESLTTCP